MEAHMETITTAAKQAGSKTQTYSNLLPKKCKSAKWGEKNLRFEI